MILRVFLGGMVIGLIIAAILYFFVLEIPANASESASPSTVSKGEAVPPALAFPADCTIGDDCWYMAYVDLDSRESYRDHMCGIRTYNAHKGTDIAPERSLDRLVTVRAAAAGRVLGVRDGMVDTPMREPEAARDAGRCGNGVRIDHGDGWTTQYCHMAKGSIGVRNGAEVASGESLGQIGSSGWSELPHLHFQLEKDGVPVDPFVGLQPEAHEDCAIPSELDHGLWSEAAAPNVDAYTPAQIVRTGLTTAVPDHDTAKLDGYPPTGPTDADALIAFIVIFGAPEGALIETEIDGPAGETVFSGHQTVAQARVDYFSYGGKKRTKSRWPSGLYTARITVSGSGPTGRYRVVGKAELILS